MTNLTALNPYLMGNFAPVPGEIDAGQLEITGSLPPELNGLLVRNGPNPIRPPDLDSYHWFTGDGMLHGIEFAGGKARYRNRWVRTPKAGAALGESTPGGVPEVSGVASVANTSIVAHSGRLFALVETALPTEIRADLSTVGAFDFENRLHGTFTAHPKVDPATGEMIIFGYDMFTKPYVNYHVVDTSGTLIQSQAIPIPRPVMMHTFAVTATKVIWFDLPVVFDLNLVGQQPFPFAWRPEHGARIGVMSRRGNSPQVQWIDIDPCYIFHEMNAFDDEDGNVILDAVVYPTMFDTDPYGPGSTSAQLQRWTINPDAGRVAVQTLDEDPQEFPRINDSLSGRPYRYGYSTEIDIGPTWFKVGSLRKHDLTRGTIERHELGTGHAAGEPIFIAAGHEEDSGWVASVVYDARRDASDIVLLDATSFSGPPVATIHLPRRVPFGFHGAWMSEATLG